MSNRRDFLKGSSVLAASAFLGWLPAAGKAEQTGDRSLMFSSPAMEVELSSTAPVFLSLNIDGLAAGRRGANAIKGNPADGSYRSASSSSSNHLRVEYRAAGADKASPAAWTLTFSGSRMVLQSDWCAEYQPPPLDFNLDLAQVRTTALGIFSNNGLLSTPVLLNFPGQGSIQLTSNVPGLALTYQSSRGQDNNIIQDSAFLSLPGATTEFKRVIYTLNVTAIYPGLSGISGDSRFDPFRRNWLNALQLNPSHQALSNNTASDTCAFTYYEFADIASLAPPLVGSLTALDVVRQTLDRILAGGRAYGMPQIPDHPCTSSDTYPSLVIAAADSVRGGHNHTWLHTNYDGIRGWADAMLATDIDGDGLIEFCISGDSGIWTDGDPKFRPSNWWDTIGFGHKDAYSNALAYRALGNMAIMAQSIGRINDATRYRNAAIKLRNAYFPCFFDPATGVLGGWRSADGKLHDYYFLFVSGIAIHYGLVPRGKASSIMDKLMAKMKEVGYKDFSLGLPGNLVSVALNDCVDRRGNGRFGCGSEPDNADGFQNYENGGATGAFAFFTLAALYDLGRKSEADAILFPMLRAYGDGGFQGRNKLGLSPDWRRWDGTSKGYEGYLADDYYTLLAVPLRQSESVWAHGFRPTTSLT